MAVIKSRSTSKYSEGNPLKTCTSCGKTYIDRDCKEPAFETYYKVPRSQYIWSAIFIGLAITFFITIIIGILSNFNSLIVIIGAAVVYSIIEMILISTSLDKYEESEGLRLKAWRKSDERLKNVEYANTLKQLGFPVPENYLIKNKLGTQPLDVQPIISASSVKSASTSCRQSKGKANKVRNDDIWSRMEIVQPPPKNQNTRQADVIGTYNQKQTDTKLYCRKCGHLIPVDSIFCPACGEKVVIK